MLTSRFRQIVSRPLLRHADTVPSEQELGRVMPDYRPTYDFGKTFINSRHRRYSTCAVPSGILIKPKRWRWFGESIPGWLQRADALKLYELAFFSRGDILEIGSYHGLSTSVLSQANRDSPVRKRIVSVEIDPASAAATRRTLGRWRLQRDVTQLCADGLAVVRDFIGSRRLFGFVFVDHGHDRDSVFTLCCELTAIVEPGGFCLFHDFNDARNTDERCPEYGVYQAVRDGLDPRAFSFYGIDGCCALYRRSSE